MAEPPIGAKLRTALEDKGWSYTRLIAEMRKVAGRQGKTLPTTASLIAMLSRWLNGHERPSLFYREILSGALGLDQAELEPGAGQELAVPLAGTDSDDRLLGSEYRGSVDGVLLDDLDALTDVYRRMDRRLGAASLFEDLTRHLQRVTAFRHASMTGASAWPPSPATSRRSWAGSLLTRDEPPAPGSTSAAPLMPPGRQRTRRSRRSPSPRRRTSH